MLITTTETLTRGVYLKKSTAIVNGKEIILQIKHLSGSKLIANLEGAYEGMINVSTFDVEDNGKYISSLLKAEKDSSNNLKIKEAVA